MARAGPSGIAPRLPSRVLSGAGKTVSHGRAVDVAATAPTDRRSPRPTVRSMRLRRIPSHAPRARSVNMFSGVGRRYVESINATSIPHDFRSAGLLNPWPSERQDALRRRPVPCSDAPVGSGVGWCGDGVCGRHDDRFRSNRSRHAARLATLVLRDWGEAVHIAIPTDATPLSVVVKTR